MKRTLERGSVIGFVIVGVLLAAMAIGGVYALNQYNASQADNASNTDTTNEETAPTENSTNSSTQPAETNNQASTEPATTQPETSTDESSNLPQTGPADSFVMMFAAVLLTVGSVAYVRSRHAAASL